MSVVPHPLNFRTINYNFEHGKMAIILFVDIGDDFNQPLHPLLLTNIRALHYVLPKIICLVIKAWISEELSLIIFISV